MGVQRACYGRRSYPDKAGNSLCLTASQMTCSGRAGGRLDTTPDRRNTIRADTLTMELRREL